MWTSKCLPPSAIIHGTEKPLDVALLLSCPCRNLFYNFAEVAWDLLCLFLIFFNDSEDTGRTHSLLDLLKVIKLLNVCTKLVLNTIKKWLRLIINDNNDNNLVAKCELLNVYLPISLFVAVRRHLTLASFFPAFEETSFMILAKLLAICLACFMSFSVTSKYFVKPAITWSVEGN